MTVRSSTQDQTPRPREPREPRDPRDPRDARDARDPREALRETEQRLQVIVDGVRDHAITMLDAEGRVVTWNAAAERITGFALDEIRGRHVRLFFEDEDRASGVPERELEVARATGSFDGEGHRRRRDGSRYAAAISLSSLRDDDGRVVGFVKITHDVTRYRELLAREEGARRRAEAAAVRLSILAEVSRVLAEEASSIDALLDALARTIARMLGDTCAVFVATDVGGLRLAALSARDETRRAPVDDPSRPRAFGRDGGVTARAFASGRTVRGEGERWSVAGAEPTCASVIAVPMQAKGKCLGVLTVARAAIGAAYEDDDARLVEELAHRAAVSLDNARLQAERREALERAEEASRMKDEFLAVVSHELRTPLAAILGWTSLLRRPRGAEPAAIARGLEVIERNARTQTKIVEDILDVSRIVRGKLAIEPRPTSLSRVAREALESVRTSAAAKEIELRIDDEAEPHVVMGDEGRLFQVVWNLLANAIKFTPEKGHVSVTLTHAARAVTLRVADDGAGIDDEFLPHVFERFRQAERSSTRRHGGLGLGLAIVRHLVEAHGGHVLVESAGLGRGSTFSVTFPVRDSQTGEPARLTSTPEVDGPESADLRGVRVLVVDDEPDATELGERVLHGYGAEVERASTVEAAIAAIARRPPDVLVADLAMPGVDGFSLLQRVRALPPPIGNLPAIALTGCARAEDEARARSAGFTGYLAKPTDSARLARAVAELVGRRA
jgi:PAS domain S-box-containing protein